MTTAPNTLKAITIHQPLAYAVCRCSSPKDVENRRRPTRHRGLLLIHAGKTYEDRGDSFRDGSPIPPKQQCHLSAIIGAVQLVDCRAYTAAELGTNPWAVGPWCYILRDQVEFSKPVPMSGQLGIWNCKFTPALLKQLRASGIAVH